MNQRWAQPWRQDWSHAGALQQGATQYTQHAHTSCEHADAQAGRQHTRVHMHPVPNTAVQEGELVRVCPVLPAAWRPRPLLLVPVPSR